MRAIAPHVPVVVMSGHSADDVVRQIPGLGAEHVLKKPFSSQDLDRVLRAVTAE
nr:MAG: hypothetical protein DIU80_22770 [Chloroflexota bacterium]